MSRGATQLPPESEAAFATWVHDSLVLYGWRWFHARPARTKKSWRTAGEGDVKGFPDLIAVHPVRGTGLAVELKSAKGRETPEQRAWLTAFWATGWRAEVWRPSDRAHALAVLRGEA